MGWTSYGLDQVAQRLVLDAKERNTDSLNQSYKMRMATAYGLERFWGEHLRLQRSRTRKSSVLERHLGCIGGGNARGWIYTSKRYDQVR